jgi:hypothetical protein
MPLDDSRDEFLEHCFWYCTVIAVAIVMPILPGGDDMTFRAMSVALLLSSLPIAGCGTVKNLDKLGREGGKSPFGGVGHDVGCIETATTVYNRRGSLWSSRL